MRCTSTVEATGRSTRSQRQGDTRLLFTGHERDLNCPEGVCETGAEDDLDYMLARYYSPVLGRFLGMDEVPGGQAMPQSWNRYSYTSNSPVNLVDPDGRQDGRCGACGYLEDTNSMVLEALKRGDRERALAVFRERTYENKPARSEMASVPAAGEVGVVIAADGVELLYRKVGDGGTPLIVPNAAYLFDGLRSLAQERQVVFYDLRNRGRSQTVTAPESLRGGIGLDVSDLEAVREHFDFDRAALLGHSYVAVVVALYACEHPERVERLVQVGPPLPGVAGDSPTTAEEWLQRDLEAVETVRQRAREAGDSEALCREYWAIMDRVMAGDPANASRLGTGRVCGLPNEWPLRMERHLRENIWPTLMRANLSAEALAPATAPTLVIHGTRDRAAPFAAGEELARRLPSARLLAVEGAGHLPWAEAPDRVIGAIGGFLAGGWPAEAVAVEEAGEE